MNWSYIAGYFDGEGHVRGLSRNSRYGLAWSNTHLESLEAMHTFMQAGHISAVARPERITYYNLIVSRQRDLTRILPCLIRHSIIKREKLIELKEAIVGRRESTAWLGLLTAIGPEEIRRLYWDEGRTLEEIGKQVGVAGSTISYYMTKHDIPRRPAWESPNRRRIGQV